jgi:hypothetical protein
MLIDNLKKSYAIYGKQMSELQSEFEKWTLFINPYSRLQGTLVSLIRELKTLNLDEVIKLEANATADEKNEYHKDFTQWIVNTERAVALGSTIRMLSPVLAESFINLLILVLSKSEYKNDQRLYDYLIRQQIDVRIKTLHLNCEGFTKAVDSDTKEFKNLLTVMNNRNDFLHGNINPKKLMFEDVYIDKKSIPLFDIDGGIIEKTTKNYLKDVEREAAINDFLIVQNFIYFTISHLDNVKQILIKNLLKTRMPGVNSTTNEIEILFPLVLAEMG